MMNKKGQLTIFVIVAIVIVAAVILIVTLTRKNVSLREQNFDNPETYLSSCLRERSTIILKDIFENGGFIGSNNTILYKGNQITYLCKNLNNFEPCINQYPLYVSQIEKEFNKIIQSDSKQCFSSLKEGLIEKGYEVDLGDVNTYAQLNPGKISIKINTSLTILKNDVSKNFNNFETYVSTDLQGIAVIVNEIISQESKWCHFSNDGFMALYPDYDVRIYMMEDSTKIYNVKNKKTGEELSMAVRGCVLPSGWF